jgi:hypothetical protein
MIEMNVTTNRYINVKTSAMWEEPNQASHLYKAMEDEFCRDGVWYQVLLVYVYDTTQVVVIRALP